MDLPIHALCYDNKSTQLKGAQLWCLEKATINHFIYSGHFIHFSLKIFSHWVCIVDLLTSPHMCKQVNASSLAQPIQVAWFILAPWQTGLFLLLQLPYLVLFRLLMQSWLSLNFQSSFVSWLKCKTSSYNLYPMHRMVHPSVYPHLLWFYIVKLTMY